ncbi:hypothetical protein Bca4012_064864 [Brassica carinata]
MSHQISENDMGEEGDLFEALEKADLVDDQLSASLTMIYCGKYSARAFNFGTCDFQYPLDRIIVSCTLKDQHVKFPIHRNKKSKQNFRRKIKIATLICHTYRVMYVAVSHDEQTIVTEAGYEILRFWNVFPSMKAQNEALRSGAGPAKQIRQDSIGVLIGPIRHPHRRSAGLLIFLKSNSNKQSIKTLHKLLCLLLYMRFKRRELVYLFRVVYMRHCFLCTGIEIIGVCLEARNSKQLEFSYCNKVWCRRRFQHSIGFLQVPGIRLDAIFTGNDESWEAWLSVDTS